MEKKSKLRKKKLDPVTQGFMNARRHEAAVSDPLLADWTIAPLKDYNKQIRQELEILRNRSRDLEENSDIGRKYISLCENSIIGPNGFNLLLPSELESVKNKFITWGKTCDAAGRLSFVDACRLTCRSVVRDGEIFIQFIRSSKFPDGFAINLIEADKIDHQYNDGDKIINGVELDDYGREIAYYLKKLDGKVTRISANDCIRVGKTERVGTTRSFPWMCSSMRNLRMLNGFIEAETVKNRLAASASIYLTRIAGTDMLPDGYDSNGNALLDIVPGSILKLEPGLDMKSFTPSATTDFKNFVNSVINLIAGGLSVSSMSLSGDMSMANYSSARLAALSEQDFFKVQQDFFNRNCISKIFIEWLKMASVSGTITAQEAEVTKANFQFHGRNFVWIDVATELEAIEKELSLKLKSRSQVLAERGLSYEQVLTKIKEDEDTEAKIFKVEDAATVVTETVTGDKQPVDVSTLSMNGAQVTALQGLVLAASAKEIPVLSAKFMAQAAFPNISVETINSIFDPISSFTPPSQEEPKATVAAEPTAAEEPVAVEDEAARGLPSVDDLPEPELTGLEDPTGEEPEQAAEDEAEPEEEDSEESSEPEEEAVEESSIPEEVEEPKATEQQEEPVESEVEESSMPEVEVIEEEPEAELEEPVVEEEVEESSEAEIVDSEDN